MDIQIGDLVYIKKDRASVIGFVDGIKYKDGDLEKLSIEGITDYWFYTYQGWEFVEVEVEDEENA